MYIFLSANISFKYKIFQHSLFALFILTFLCSICSILIFRNFIFCMYLLCFFCSILNIFYVINFECYFIVSSCTIFSNPFAISLTTFYVEVMSYCCFLRAFTVCSVFIVLFYILPELCLLGFHLWLLFYSFFFKSLCLLFDTCLFLCLF